MLTKHFLLCLASATLLSGCADTLTKLEEVGKPPKLAKVEDPTQVPGYQPMTWPMPEVKAPSKEYTNSLWQPGARAFFRDQRAARVGDILRVKIKINDQAQVNNETERNRESDDSLSASPVFGLEKRLFGWLPGKADPTNLLAADSTTKTKGKGTIKRQDTVTTQVAALVTQVLPNGNFVIEGSQEMRVNYDIREISVRGVVRPQDIDTDNTIDSTQVAEARIVYGGRGQLQDVQQPRYGSQIVDILSPF